MSSEHEVEGGPANKLAGDVKWDTEAQEPYMDITEGVRFTPVRSGDVDGWYELYVSPGVAEGAYLRKEPYTKEKATKAVEDAITEQQDAIKKLHAGESKVSEWPLQVIRAHPSGEFMGLLGIYPTDPIRPLPTAPFENTGPVGTKSFDIGYMLLPQFSGKGIMKAAVKVALEGYAAPVMNIYQIGAEVRENHPASLAILRANGFEELYRYSQKAHPDSGVKDHTATKFRKVLPGTTLGPRKVSKRLEKVWWDGDEPYLMVNGDVRVTPVRKSDAEGWRKHWSNPLIMIGDGTPMSIEQAEKITTRLATKAEPVIERLRAGHDAIDGSPFEVIRSHPDGAIMGILGMHHSRHPLPAPERPNEQYPWADKTTDVWYNMSPDYRGRGCTKASVKALIEQYMGPIMRLPLVGAGVNVDHTVSRAILTGCGFEEEFKYERFRPNVDPIPRLKMVRRLDQSSYD